MDLCVYCESLSETDYARVGDRFLQLCEECRLRFDAPAANEEDVMNSPVELPPGATQLEHTCPALLLDRVPLQEATFSMQLTPINEKYLFAECPWCGTGVRSKRA